VRLSALRNRRGEGLRHQLAEKNETAHAPLPVTKCGREREAEEGKKKITTSTLLTWFFADLRGGGRGANLERELPVERKGGRGEKFDTR